MGTVECSSEGGGGGGKCLLLEQFSPMIFKVEIRRIKMQSASGHATQIDESFADFPAANSVI